MKKLLLFTLLLTSLLFPQLKEIEVKPTENRGGIPIFTEYPDKAGIIFYTQYDNLTFYSSYGIHSVMGDPASGKYVVIVEPARQSLEIRCPGHKSEIIKLGDIQPRDVLFYEVLPKKNPGLQGISELAITLQVKPEDAIITIDGAPFPNNVSTKVEVGKHSVKIIKEGFEKIEQEISVSPENTLFKFDLSRLELVELTIDSKPDGAEFFIDENSKGQTKKTIFIFPGEYELKLVKRDYFPISRKIKVSKIKSENILSFELTKSAGFLMVSATPSNATILLNRSVIQNNRLIETAPGLYQIEVSKDGYLTYTGNIMIELGKTTIDTITLQARTGALQFTVNPVETSCILLKDGKEVSRWQGLKIIQDLWIGNYKLMASLNGYKPVARDILIEEGETSVQEIIMVKEKYFPLDLAQKKVTASGDRNVNIYGLTQENETSLTCSYEFNGIDNEEYEVEFFLRKPDDPGFRASLDAATGDIGSIVYKKGIKKFTIDLSKSYIVGHPDLQYYFEIEINSAGSGLAWFYYVIGGAVAGGTAAILILTSGDKSETAPFTVGTPPVRP